MGTDLKTLDIKMQEHLPVTGKMVIGEGAFMEVIDPATTEIWMCSSGVTREDFHNWNPEPPYQKTGMGNAIMNRAAFRHDPDGQNKPVRVKVIGGHECYHVAKPGEMVPPEEDGMPMKISVIKGHTLGYEADRKVKIMTIGEDHYVQVIGQDEWPGLLTPPDGGKFWDLELEQPWIVELPFPTTTFFWRSEDGPTSFQGPVTLPADQE